MSPLRIPPISVAPYVGRQRNLPTLFDKGAAARNRGAPGECDWSGSASRTTPPPVSRRRGGCGHPIRQIDACRHRQPTLWAATYRRCLPQRHARAGV